ncbi:MAG TPA: hypothetical protein VL100_13345 [Croceibacterium sp.]|nr:hypothetical protein [Croceibacterium sp.]
MKLRYALVLACVASPVFAQTQLNPADEKAAFTAAGFASQDGKWVACPDDVTASYTPGAIEQVIDANGDGQPEALISESSSFCYGMQGAGYSVVSRQADGSWKLITSGSGMPTFLTTKGANGWPDLEIGGPGFCFAVERWNGSEYVLNRHEYEGKRCKPEG